MKTETNLGKNKKVGEKKRGLFVIPEREGIPILQVSTQMSKFLYKKKNPTWKI